MVIRVEMLGGTRVTLEDGTAVALRPTVRDQALAVLACTADWVARERLGFLFWPDFPDDTARHNVRQLLKRIRRLSWAQGIEADVDRVRWLVPSDLADLRAALDAGRWGDLPEACELLPGLEATAPLEYVEWLGQQRRNLRDAWQSARLSAAADAETRGEPGPAARLLRPMLAGDDADQLLHRYLDLAVRAGDRVTALATYDEVVERLRRDLDVEPPRGAAELASRLRHREREPGPARLRSVVGRGTEIAELSTLLARPECRLVTLLGPGGIGKSTLARLLAHRLAPRYADGAAVVSLETSASPGDVASRIARDLATPLEGGVDTFAQVVAALRRRHRLVVLDNAEHVPSSWSLFAKLLAACPQLALVVTSRERLRLTEEWVYDVGGMPDDDAVALFAQQAARLAPHRPVDREQTLAVCHAVGGSPLGIRLAAPWLRVMPAAEVVRRITDDVGSLAGAGTDTPARHRSVAAAMDHSWLLLSPEERAVAEGLSVCAATFTEDLAVDVADASPLLLRDLVDKSVLQTRGDGRYGFHPLVRQYAAGRLAAADKRRRAARDRHARAVLTAVTPMRDGSVDAPLVDDAVAAWRHAVHTGAADLAGQAVVGLVALLAATGRCEEGLGLLAEETPAGWLMAAVEEGRATLLQSLGRHADAAAAAERTVAAAIAAGDDRLRVRAAVVLAWARKWLDGDDAQYAICAEVVPVAEATGDDELSALVANGLGCSAPTLEQCRDHLVFGLTLARRAGQRRLEWALLNNLGSVTWGLGDTQAAVELLETALDVSQDTPPWDRGHALAHLAFLHAERGDLFTAQTLAADAAALVEDTEMADARLYVALVDGEIQRAAGNWSTARDRARTALSLADERRNEAMTLRALRLHGRLLVDAGSLDDGLAVLSFVTPQVTRKGDWASTILNPRTWAEVTAGLPADAVRRAEARARRSHLPALVSAALAGDRV